MTAFSDDGSLVAVGSEDGRLRMFDVGAGAVRDVFRTQSLPISQVVISPGNGVLGAVTADRQLRLHSSGGVQGFDQYRQSSLQNSAQQRGIGIHTARVTAGAWHPQGQLLATAAADASIHLWDVPLKDALELSSGSDPVAAVTVNPDNDVVAIVSQSGQVRLLDFADQSVLQEFTVKDSGTITRIALVTNSDIVLLGTQDGTILAYSSVRGEEITRLSGHKGEVTSLTVAADGRSFLSADSVGQLKLWRLPLNAASQLVRFDAEVDELRVTADRRHAAALVRGRGLSLVRLTTPPLIRPVSGRSDDLTAISFVQVGSVLVGASRSGAVRFWSVPEGELIAETAAHNGAIRGLAPHPRQQTVATAGEDGRIRILEVPSRLPQIRSPGGKLVSLSTSSDGLLLAAQNDDGQVRLWQTVNGSQIGQLGGHKGRVTAFAAGREWIAVGDESGSVRFLTSDTIQPSGDVQLDSAAVAGLALSNQAGVAYAVDDKGVVRELTLPPPADRSLKLPGSGLTAVASVDGGRRAFVAGLDRSLQQVELTGDAPSGKTIGQMASVATTIAAADDGAVVVTGHADGGVEFHGTARAALRFETGSSASVSSVTVDSAKQRALTAHQDGTVREWDLSVAIPAQFAADQQKATLVAVSPDGSLAALATARKTVRVLQVADGSLIQDLNSFQSEITALAWEGAGSHLLIAEQGGSVRRIEGRTGREVAAWTASGSVTAIADLPGRPEFLVGLESGAVQRWTVTAGPGIELRPAGDGPIQKLVVMADSAVQIRAGQKLEQWDAQKGQKTGEIPDTVTGVLLSGSAGATGSFSVADSGVVTFQSRTTPPVSTQWNCGSRIRSAVADARGTRFVFITEDGTLRILKSPLLRSVKAPSSAALAANWDAVGNGILAALADAQIIHWAADSGVAEARRKLSVVEQSQSNVALNSVALASGGSVIAGLAGASAFVWSSPDGDPRSGTAISLPAEGRWLKLNRLGTRLLIGLENGEVWLIDTAHRALLERLLLPSGAYSIAEFATDGTSLLIGGASAELRIHHPAVRRVLATDAKSAASVAIDEATQQFSIVGADGSVRIWDEAAEPVVNRTAADGEAARLTVLSGNGEWVAQVYGESSIGVRRVRDGLKPTLFTVESPVRSLAVNFDGQLLAVATVAGTRVLDRAGNPVQMIDREKPVELVTFVGRQSTLALSSDDGSIEFSAYSNTEGELKIDGPVAGVAFSAGATQLVSWDDRRVRLWNLESGDELLQFDNASASMLKAGFADGDRLVVGAAQDGRVYVWSLADRKLRNQFVGPADPRQVAIATSGAFVTFVRQNGQLETYSLSNGELLETCNASGVEVQSVALRADDLAVFSGARNGHITERSLSAVTSITAHGPQRVTDATFSSRNGFILSCGEDGTVALHQSQGQLVRKFEGATGTPVGVAESPDSSIVCAVTATDDASQLTTWKFADGTLLQQTPLPVKVEFCRQSPNGLLAAVSRTGVVQMVNTATGEPTERISTIGEISDVAVAGAAQALVTGSSDGSVLAYPFHLVASFRNPGVATSIDWSADGRYLAAGTAGLISIWDVQSQAVATEIPIKALPPDEPAETAKGGEKMLTPAARQKAATNSLGARVKTAGAKPGSKTNDETPANPPPGNLTTQVLISPRGELCASFVDGSVRLWNLRESSLPDEAPVPHTIFRHPSPVLAIAIDPLGTQVACGCEDSNIWVWEIESGRELARFSGHLGAVHALAFEATGERLFSTGADRAAKVWPLQQPGSSNRKPAVEIAMADSSQQLRTTLEKQIKSAEKAEDRTRLRELIRTLDRSDGKESDGSVATETDGEISRLRAALRESSTTDNREASRRELLVALRERELKQRLNKTSTQTERERLREELARLHSAGWNTHRLNSGEPVGKLAEIDREFVALSNDDSQKSVLKEQIQDMLRETPIWPRTRQETWSRDETHLLAAIPTHFNFDTSLRQVELALTADGLTLAAARESARLNAPVETRKAGVPRRAGSAEDDETQRRVQGVVRAWDVLTGTELRAWTDVEGSIVRSVRFSASGDTIVTAPDLFAFRLSTGESRELARGVSLATSSDHQLAAVGLPGQALEMTDAVRLVDLDAMQFLPVQFEAYEATVPAVALSNDGTILVAAVRERARHRLIEFDARTLKQRAVLEEFEHRSPWNEGTGTLGITHLAFSPDDRYLVAYGAYRDDDYRLTAVQMATRKSSVIENDAPLVRRNSPVPFLFTGTRGQLVIDTPTGLMVINMADGQTIDELTYKSLPAGDRLVTLSSDGMVAAFGDESGVITLRKLGQDQGRVQFQAHAGPVVGIAFAQGDRMLVTAGEENQIRIWSLVGFLHSRQAADPIEKKVRTGISRKRRP